MGSTFSNWCFAKDRGPPPSWLKDQILVNLEVWVSTCPAQRTETDIEGLQFSLCHAGVLFCDKE